MAKKKVIDLHAQKLSFTQKDQTYTLISFNTSSMTLRCILEDAQKQKKEIDFPFAHLPKELKKMIKPL
ncbi:MAG: hypothetical protein OEW60_04935 [Thiovulaceae bacterium]|nr:hypothetical protein [Sulfurimonadaceae bacterium]